MKYSIISLVNASSQDAVAAYSTYIHEAILRDITQDNKLELNIVSYPFPLSKKE